MKLLYKNRAYIAPEKIKDYLLSPTHEKGRHKARVFQSIGFNFVSKDLFEKALLKIAHTNDINEVKHSEKDGKYYGKKYIIRGTIAGPNGSMIIETVWIILENKRKPSLVTVNPL